MSEPPPIRILAPPEKVGDLFTRLSAHIFIALGYENPRLNIAKPGREIDIDARHRTEPRRAVAEVKATKKPVGGDDVNKFIGVLTAERIAAAGKEEVHGYFVSLSGFTGTALEQERLCGVARLVLLDGKRVVQELVDGRIVVPPSKALARAVQCAAVVSLDLSPEAPPFLLVHEEVGWLWAVLFRRRGEASHISLVHADGDVLSTKLARRVLETKSEASADLRELVYLPSPLEHDLDGLAEEAKNRYFSYLEAECGGIELIGLPADQDLGARRLNLESLFVPLHLEIPGEKSGRSGHVSDSLGIGEDKDAKAVRFPLGQVLATRARVAILAPPGGGKSTLLKRLAVAYAFPERRTQLGDQLPDRDWVPVLLRCRKIEEEATMPITVLLERLAVRAEMGDLADVFKMFINAALREGQVLLLVDGLDEIANIGKRREFVEQLRSFLATYPSASVIITSREAGFQPVARLLVGYCDNYRIAEFDKSDIERLTVAWYRVMVGSGLEIEGHARVLAATIWETNRVKILATNPLLLTTLLLVRRWVGQLPNRRTVLYEKAIEVLLWTWNAEGFDPVDPQEVVPQLAFLAYHMMEIKIQQISKPQLRAVLESARQQMPEVLSYTRLSIGELIERVEQRSGILLQGGQAVEDGHLVPIYEFRHLTFQEYLAARAVTEGYYAGRLDSDTLVSKLEPHFRDEAWREVIPLAAVLAGLKATPLVQALVAHVRSLQWN